MDVEQMLSLSPEEADAYNNILETVSSFSKSDPRHALVVGMTWWLIHRRRRLEQQKNRRRQFYRRLRRLLLIRQHLQSQSSSSSDNTYDNLIGLDELQNMTSHSTPSANQVDRHIQNHRSSQNSIPSSFVSSKLSNCNYNSQLDTAASIRDSIETELIYDDDDEEEEVDEHENYIDDGN